MVCGPTTTCHTVGTCCSMGNGHGGGWLRQWVWASGRDCPSLVCTLLDRCTNNPQIHRVASTQCTDPVLNTGFS